MELRAIQACAEEVARRVAERLRLELSSPEHARFERKGPTDLVTEFDIWAEHLIEAAVHDAFPDHAVVGEETAAKASLEEQTALTARYLKGVCWVIDPIDGTTNFTNRIPFLTTSIGVLVNGVRSVGVVLDPVRDELFSAVRGAGATLNGIPIRPSGKKDLIDAVVATDFPYAENLTHPVYGPIYQQLSGDVRALRSFGSSTLEQCWIACGRLDVYFEQGLKPWDVAAASLIVEEAGARALNLESQREFSLVGNAFLFATPKLFEKVAPSI